MSDGSRAGRLPTIGGEMGNMLGRFTIVLAAFAALIFGVSSASAQSAPDPGTVAGDVAPAAPAAEGPAAESPLEALPEAADPVAKAPPGGSPSKLALQLKGLNKGKLTAGNKVKLEGTLRPFDAGEKVTAIVYRGKKTIKRKSLVVKRKPGTTAGKFKLA